MHWLATKRVMNEQNHARELSDCITTATDMDEGDDN